MKSDEMKWKKLKWSVMYVKKKFNEMKWKDLIQIKFNEVYWTGIW